MSSPLQALEPQSIWTHFDAIRQVPRPSKHEERISRHVRRWAGEQGTPHGGVELNPGATRTLKLTKTTN